MISNLTSMEQFILQKRMEQYGMMSSIEALDLAIENGELSKQATEFFTKHHFTVAQDELFRYAQILEKAGK